MPEKIVYLYNRDGIETSLEFVSGTKCYFRSKLEYFQITSDAYSGSIISIDPPGGPRISIGLNYISPKSINVKEINKDENGYYLILDSLY